MQKGLPAREAPFAVWQGAARQAGDPSAALRFVRLRFRARGRCAPYADAFALCVLQIALARSETLVFAFARDPSAALRSVFGLAGAVRPTRMRLRFALCKSRSPEAKRSFLPLQASKNCAFLQDDGEGAHFFRMTEWGMLLPDDGKAGFFRMTGGAAPAARDDGEACVFSIRRAHARPYKRKSCARMIYEEKPVRSKGRARFFPFPRYAPNLILRAARTRANQVGRRASARSRGQKNFRKKWHKSLDIG